MTFENAELRAFTAAIEGKASATEKQVQSVVHRGANNIKNQLREEMGRSGWFGQIAPTITYDMKTTGAFGGGIIEAEIGPNKHFRAARLANIAYFGSSRGGGTVPDPRGAGEAELPNFEKHIGDLAEDI